MFKLKKRTKEWLYPVAILCGIVVIIGCIGSSLITSFKETLKNKEDDEYILKSSIVPPVCPKCPDLVNTNEKSKCPPCPPCGRCPENPVKCAPVPNYNVNPNDISVVRPNITPQI